jgi:hypothetical protein
MFTLAGPERTFRSPATRTRHGRRQVASRIDGGDRSDGRRTGPWRAADHFAPPGTSRATRETPEIRPTRAAARLAVLRRRSGQGPHRNRVADVRVRRLSALGYGDRDRSGPELARERIRRPALGNDPNDRSTDDTGSRRQRSGRDSNSVLRADRRAGSRAEHSCIQRGRRVGPPRDPPYRRRLDRRRRCGEERSQEGPGPLPGDPAARPTGQRRYRGTSHHLRAAVLQHRATAAGRRDHHHRTTR